MTHTDTQQAIQEIMESLGEDIEYDQLVNKLVDKNIITTDDVTRLNMLESNERTQELLVILFAKGASFRPLISRILAKLETPSAENTRRADQAIEQAAGSTGNSGEGVRAVSKTERGILSNTNVSPNWELKMFLYELSKNIDSSELEDMKDLMRGESGFKENVSKMERPMTFFTKLMQTGRLTAYNLHFLQALVRKIGRLDLNNRVRQFCLKSNKNPIHFFTPNETPVNGYTYVRHHIDGDIEKLTHVEKERLRADVANVLCVGLEEVYISGIEPAASILFTFMVPEDDVRSFIQIYGKEGLSTLQMSIHIHVEGDELSFSESPHSTASNPTPIFQEMKHLLEREENLEEQLADRDEQLMNFQEEIENFQNALGLQPYSSELDIDQHQGPWLQIDKIIAFRIVQNIPLNMPPWEDVQKNLAIMTRDLSKKERRKLRDFLRFSDLDKKLLKQDFTKLLELAVLREYGSGVPEKSLNDFLRDIMAKVKKSHVVDKYFIVIQEPAGKLQAGGKAVQTQVPGEAEKASTACAP